MIHSSKQVLEDLLAECGGLYSVGDIISGCASGLYQSWLASDGTWMVTQVLQFPRKKVVESMFTIGSIEGALEIQPRVVEFAIKEGASQVRGYGRPGWDAVWRKRPEWKKERHLYVMELDK